MLESFAPLAAGVPRHSFIRPWFVALVYLGLVAVCFWIGRRDRHGHRPRRSPGTWLWLALAILFAALGVGKLVDAQGALTDLLRKEAIQEEWYQFRRPIQVGVVAASVVVAVLGAFAGRRFGARGESWRDRAVLAPVALLLVFYAVRATSWHLVDAVLFRFVAGTRINTWAELAIQGLIAAALLDHAHRGQVELVLANQGEGGRAAAESSADGSGGTSS